MKKLLALIMAAIMVACLTSIVIAEENADGLLAHYTFDDNKADEGLTEYGEQLMYADGKVTLGDSSNTSYLVSDLDLTGLEEITIGMKLTLPQNVEGGGQWIYDITSQESHDGQADGAFGFAMYYESGIIHAQVYAGCASPVPPTEQIDAYVGHFSDDEFVTVVVTYTADKVLSLYVEDEMDSWEVEADADFATIIGETPVLQIGRCSWGSGYYGRAIQIDEVSIYGCALTEDEVSETFGIVMSDEPETDAGTEKPGNDAPTTDAPTTNSPAESGDSAGTTDKADDEGGCGSVMGASAVIITVTAVFGSAIINFLRRTETRKSTSCP